MKKVKIVCTIGPACSEREILMAMVDAGMNVARFNFSHGTHEQHSHMLELIRDIEEEKDYPIAAILDTKGPEIRTGLMSDGSVELEQGKSVVLTTRNVMGNKEEIPVTYSRIAEEVSLGQNIFIDDGTIQLHVEKVESQDVICRIVVGGILGDRKGINIPGAALSISTMSEKDREDILWGVKNDVEYVAVSFVRNRNDIMAIRRVIEDADGVTKIIAKIETSQAVENIDEILEVVDGVMIARGDLGVEIPTENVPLVQKDIIEKSRIQGKVVIVATQMLDSMIRNPRPTRAEASDVANAVLDGADALMLSGETAAGGYPVRAVETMSRIIARAEEGLTVWQRDCSIPVLGNSVPDAVSRAAVDIAREMGAKTVLSLTSSGSTARMVSKYRPPCPIIGATPYRRTWRELSISWGVVPVMKEKNRTDDEAVEAGIAAALRKGLIAEGDLVVITAGMPTEIPGTTNMVRVHTIGRILVKGIPLLKKVISGRVCKANSAEEARKKIVDGDILVVRSTNREYMSAIEKASAIITEEGGLTSHAAIVALEYGIPCVVSAYDAMEHLQDNMIVTVDGGKGLVYEGIVNLGN